MGRRSRTVFRRPAGAGQHAGAALPGDGPGHGAAVRQGSPAADDLAGSAHGIVRRHPRPAADRSAIRLHGAARAAQPDRYADQECRGAGGRNRPTDRRRGPAADRHHRGLRFAPAACGHGRGHHGAGHGAAAVRSVFRQHGSDHHGRAGFRHAAHLAGCAVSVPGVHARQAGGNLMPSRLPRTPLAWALTLMLGACSSVPERPAPDVPESWFHAVREQPADAEALADWWQQFDDPALTQLVRRALENNRDIRLAMLRVDTARAQLRQARAGLFPTFDLPGSASRQWIENNNEPNPDSPIGEFVPDDDVITFDSWELALQATWELDIFGSTRARTDSARQQIRSAQAQAIAAPPAVASNSAQGYVQPRARGGQRALLVEGIELAAGLERIARALFEAGEVTRLDVEASAAERASLEADLDELDINLAEARLALDTLLAEPPGSTAHQLTTSARVPLAEQAIPAGQPLDLLRRRPDLIAEAAQLEAAQLQSLAARRDMFPTLAVQAAVGRSGLALG